MWNIWLQIFILGFLRNLYHFCVTVYNFIRWESRKRKQKREKISREKRSRHGLTMETRLDNVQITKSFQTKKNGHNFSAKKCRILMPSGRKVNKIIFSLQLDILFLDWPTFYFQSNILHVFWKMDIFPIISIILFFYFLVVCEWQLMPRLACHNTVSSLVLKVLWKLTYPGH